VLVWSLLQSQRNSSSSLVSKTSTPRPKVQPEPEVTSSRPPSLLSKPLTNTTHPNSGARAPPLSTPTSSTRDSWKTTNNNRRKDKESPDPTEVTGQEETEEEEVEIEEEEVKEENPENPDKKEEIDDLYHLRTSTKYYESIYLSIYIILS
jgi:hypothetical protein